MKKFFLFLSFSLLCLAWVSCRDDNYDNNRHQPSNNSIEATLVGTWVSRPYQNTYEGDLTMVLKSNKTGTFTESYDFEEAWEWDFMWECRDNQLILSVEDEGDVSDIVYQIDELTKTKLMLTLYGMVEMSTYEFYKN